MIKKTYYSCLGMIENILQLLGMIENLYMDAYKHIIANIGVKTDR